tara:strand:- start:382 stop:522 length:141 start_codon:yes stop_codon:yes gene_type:complete
MNPRINQGSRTTYLAIPMPLAPDDPDTDFIFGLTGNSVPPIYCTTP